MASWRAGGPALAYLAQMNETRDDPKAQRAPAIPTLQAALARAGHYDELRGHIRPATRALPQLREALFAQASSLTSDWCDFFAHMQAHGSDALNQQLTTLQRQIRDNGVTYNVYSDEGGPQRPWSLDLFPLLIDAQSWQHIESGVRQRMRLLESIMADVYGPQTLLDQGLLPAALVLGHPGSCAGCRV